MKNTTLPASVSRDRERQAAYKTLSLLFAYPDDAFFNNFPQFKKDRKKLITEYDVLFRNKGIWLYSSEYTAKEVFQKSNQMSDIAGFYRAFGLELDEERPDALTIELEFMHYIIFKSIYAVEKDLPDAHEKRLICIEAQKKFFNEHLYPGARTIAEKINAEKDEFLYKEFSRRMLDLLEDEKAYLNTAAN